MKFVLVAGLSVLASGAAAQDRLLSFDLGLGAQSAPGYFGDSDAEAAVSTTFIFDQLVFGGLSLGGGDPNGISFKGGFRSIGERTADDYAELAGLADVDAALELGGGVTLTYQPDGVAQKLGSYAFAEVRYGVVGHESFVAKLGADLIYKPTAPWEFRAGPRLFAGDDDYADTYFSDSRVDYVAGGGLLSGGVELSAAYDFNDTWGVIGTATYEQFVNDAADSPIVQAGSDDQLSVSLMITRAFSFQF
jgi:outer membrane scaffolding protein for murein synthesis (MipA/OmpV family)